MRSRLLLHSQPADLRRAIDRADAATPALVSSVLDLLLSGSAIPMRLVVARRVRELIAAEAWTEAALALVSLDHTRAVRRISFEDGEWRCVIGAKVPLPDWLDDTIESAHEALALAILGALVDAVQLGPATMPRVRTRSATNGVSGRVIGVGCDNYS